MDARVLTRAAGAMQGPGLSNLGRAALALNPNRDVSGFGGASFGHGNDVAPGAARRGDGAGLADMGVDDLRAVSTGGHGRRQIRT